MEVFAEKAVEMLPDKEGNGVVGLQNGSIGSVELQKSCDTDKALDLGLLELGAILAT